MSFNRQTNNQQQAQQVNVANAAFNFKKAMNLPDTEPVYKYLLNFVLIVIPMTLFFFFLNVSYDTVLNNLGINLGLLGNNYGLTILISFGWLAIVQGIIWLLIKKFEWAQADLYLPAYMAMGFMMAFYVIPQATFGWRWFWAIFTTMLGKMVGQLILGIAMFSMSMKKMKQAQKQMMDMQMAAQAAKDPNFTKKKPMSKAEMKKQRMAQHDEAMKREQEQLDQMLREQGIDIDKLDKEFGSYTDTGKSSAIDVEEEEDIEIL